MMNSIWQSKYIPGGEDVYMMSNYLKGKGNPDKCNVCQFLLKWLGALDDKTGYEGRETYTVDKEWLTELIETQELLGGHMNVLGDPLSVIKEEILCQINQDLLMKLPLAS